MQYLREDREDILALTFFGLTNPHKVNIKVRAPKGKVDLKVLELHIHKSTYVS